MKIALDVMGGDNAPDINVDGAKRALQDFPLIEKIYLVGREETVRSSCDRWGLSGPRVEIVPAAEVVEMNESGLLAVRKKKIHPCPFPWIWSSPEMRMPWSARAIRGRL
nr:hypothetical protein [Akkermansia muciniphila]